MSYSAVNWRKWSQRTRICRSEGGRKGRGGRRGRGGDTSTGLTGVMLQDEVAALLGRKEELKDAVASVEQERDTAREKHK